MYCIQCGKENHGAPFCIYCGAAKAVEIAPVVVPALPSDNVGLIPGNNLLTKFFFAVGIGWLSLLLLGIPVVGWIALILLWGGLWAKSKERRDKYELAKRGLRPLTEAEKTAAWYDKIAADVKGKTEVSGEHTISL
ncbi:MAG: zinc ribbon domain-containing protein [Candidatus Korobacteraceae bacterium]|jgi:hypothetical protein